MKGLENPKPHITLIQIVIAVLLVTQMLSFYQENKVHQELYEALVEVQKNLNQTIENQNLHLQNILDLVDLLRE